MTENSKMFIPKNLKVGYQERKGTYTGKLAYVIYFDEKGKLRKEGSWESWRDKKIDPSEIPNDPVEGFVLNKEIGGVRYSWGWDARLEKVRVYDPRDFEFEISIPNLLFILQETSAIKGKGLEGEFVYAWSGTELVLLPVGSNSYKECVVHTQRQSIKMNRGDVKEGFSYITKGGGHVMYLGRHHFSAPSYRSTFNPVGLKHIFFNLKYKKNSYSTPYIAENGFTKIAECTSSASLPIYPDELDKFKESDSYGEIKGMEFVKVEFQNRLHGETLFIKENEKYYPASFSKQYYYDQYVVEKLKSPFSLELKNGKFHLPQVTVPSAYNHGNEFFTMKQMNKLDIYKIKVINSKGKEFVI